MEAGFMPGAAEKVPSGAAKCWARCFFAACPKFWAGCKLLKTKAQCVLLVQIHHFHFVSPRTHHFLPLFDAL